MTDPSDLESVRALLGRNREKLMAQYRAHGVGVGRADERYGIVIYLDAPEDNPGEAVTLDGVPLKFEVTGPFTTQTT